MVSTEYVAGTSVPAGRGVVREWLREVRPRAAVDFGTGEGAMGRLVRRALGRHVELTGCDVWPPAIRICRKLPGVYDRVSREDVRTHARRCVSGPGILWCFGDVLEHLPFPVAAEILEQCDAEWLLLRIPVGPWPQWGLPNKVEDHLWTFYPKLLKEFRMRYHMRIHIAPRRRGFPAFADLRDRRVYDAPWLYIGSFLLHRRAG